MYFDKGLLRKIRENLFCLLVATALALSLVNDSAGESGASAPSASENGENLRLDLETFQESFVEIRRRFIEPKSSRDLIRNAIKGMVEELGDPYSTYMLRERAEKMKSALNEEDSDLTGIGVQLGYEDGDLKVISPILDSPAWRAGMQAGDLIVEVDGEPILDIDDAVSRITGKEGTPVAITVSRPGLEEPIVFNLVRERIKYSNIVRELLCSKIGYIRLYSFSSQSTREVHEALTYLNVSGCQGFVFDLRNNPGGLLNAAVGVSNLFLKKDLTSLLFVSFLIYLLVFPYQMAAPVL